MIPLQRGIAHFLDLSEPRKDLARFYIHIERSSADPELLIEMQIVGYT